MSKPIIHANSSATKYGGKPEDYLDIHEFMDSSKASLADNRHRALTHNAWFVGVVLEKVFGSVRTNSDGKVYSIRDIGEDHVLEDYGGRFIPSAQDWLSLIPFQDWMNNGKGTPPSTPNHQPTENTSEIIENIHDSAKKLIKDSIAKSFRVLFDKHPKLLGINWQQYTPYFSDGDECIFRVYDDFYINVDADVNIPNEVDSREKYSRRFHSSDYGQSPDAYWESIFTDISAVFSLFGEEDLRYAYGDHKDIVMTRNGAEIYSFDHE